MAGGNLGKRRHVRKIAAWPAWVRFHRSARYIKGRTANVSRGGAYVMLPLSEAAPDGKEADYILAKPGKDEDHYVIQAVSGQATVVRVVPGADGAVALEFVKEEDIE